MLCHLLALLTLSFGLSKVHKKGICGNNSIPISANEFQLLQNFYDSTGGHDWIWKGDGIPWNFSATSNPFSLDDLLRPCAADMPWEGIECALSFIGFNFSNFTCQIVSISLNSHNLHGTIPQNLSEIRNLRNLELQENYLSQTVPTSISTLYSLTHLDLSSNYLVGHLPIGLFTNLTRLEFLSLYRNLLSGPLPGSFSEKTHNIRFISLYYNSFEGEIPSSYQYIMGSIEYFSVTGNYLQGTIPDYFGNMTRIRYLSLEWNYFYGPIEPFLNAGPFEFLSSLVVARNSLDGTLPPSLCNLSSLLQIALYQNEFDGTLPSCLGTRMSQLEIVDFDTNHLEGPLPLEVVSNPRLVYLSLYNNFFTGEIPSAIENAKSLHTLDLTNNKFSGTLPETLTQLRNLHFILISENFFTGEEILTNLIFTKNMSQLEIFSITLNYFSGTIPTTIAVLNKSLIQLLISSNYFTGPIPPHIGSLMLLTQCIMKQNLLSGKIPSSFGSLAHLNILSLGNNMLTGPIPRQLGNLSVLTYLDLNSNKLSSSIPWSLGKISHLKELVLLNNSLTGSVPACIFTIPSLLVLSIGLNCFQGSLPSCTTSKNVTTSSSSSSLFSGIPQASTYSSSLQVLNMNDLTSGLSCRIYPINLKIFGMNEAGFISRNKIDGSIPSCLWSLPNLEALYLSGNGLDGPLNADNMDIKASKLLNVSLSFNHLTGTIPDTLQSYGKFYSFDVSHNRLSGTLNSNLKTPKLSGGLASSHSFQLSVNRLSGSLPANSNFTQMHDLIEDVLLNNLFTFTDESLSDSAYNGSEILNISIFIILFLFFFCPMTLFLSIILSIGLLRKSSDKPIAPPIMIQLIRLRSEFVLWWEAAMNFPNFLSSSRHSPSVQLEIKLKFLGINGSLNRIALLVRSFIKFTYRLSLIVLSLSLLLIFIFKFIPLLRSIFCTISYQQAWSLSSAFIHGIIPAIVLKVLLFCFLFLMILFVLMVQKRSENAFPLLSPAPALPLFVALKNKNTPCGDASSSSKTSPSLRPVPLSSMLSRITLPLSDLSLRLALSPEWRKILLMSSLLFLFDVVFMLGINIWYLALILNHNSIFYPIIFGTMKALWNSFYIPKSLQLLNYTSGNALHKAESLLLWFGISVSMFNVIVAPCLATVLSDRGCILDLFSQQELPPLEYSYQACQSYTAGTEICIQNETVQFSGSGSNPPFVYNFSCGSQLIVQYVPLIFYSTFLTGFFFPFSYLVALCAIHLNLLSESWESFVVVFMPLLQVDFEFEFNPIKLSSSSSSSSSSTLKESDGDSDLNFGSLSTSVTAVPDSGFSNSTKRIRDQNGSGRERASVSGGGTSGTRGSMFVTTLQYINTSVLHSKIIENILKDVSAEGGGVRDGGHEDDSALSDDLGDACNDIVLSAGAVVYRHLIHLTVLLTFGLACPLLGIMASVGAFIETRMLLLLLARRKYLSDNGWKGRKKVIKSPTSKHTLTNREMEDLGIGEDVIEQDVQQDQGIRMSNAASFPSQSLHPSFLPSTTPDTPLSSPSQKNDLDVDDPLDIEPQISATTITSNPFHPSLSSRPSLLPSRASLHPTPAPWTPSRPSLIPSLSLSMRPSFSTQPADRPSFARQLTIATTRLFSLDLLDSDPQSTFNSVSRTAMQKQLWNSVVGCVWLIVIISETFWLIQIFDMIADLNGTSTGVLISFIGFAVSLVSIYFLTYLCLRDLELKPDGET